MAAFSSGATVIPIAVTGSYQMMPRKTYLINIVPVSIKFGEPMSFKKYLGTKPGKNDYEVELKRLREEIQGLLGR